MASTSTSSKSPAADADKNKTADAPEQKPNTTLGEDDEFEDFPIDDWPQEQTEAAEQGSGEAKHLWEESWDDDDNTDDFSAQLKEELKKVEAAKRK
ncbi:hypothetical protein CDD82_7893 [Ophiocordyceps australis]|uniref:26S proteasome complex subunit SEM1 n=1 Tax=Ophiocordyceps australis TaxID=1399860 RepID=A0A2C5YIB7_9HYPO|nr:hypothetical protein CDD82_2553 [Ophiocordyceps australis]PHH69255.1 hypothetical protein CDD82_7893 [Ophiocordyceps australis]